MRTAVVAAPASSSFGAARDADEIEMLPAERGAHAAGSAAA